LNLVWDERNPLGSPGKISGFIMLLFAMSLAFLGTVAISSYEEIHLDRNLRQLQYSKHSIFGANIKIYPFEKIVKVDLVYFLNEFYRPRISTQCGQKLNLHSIRDSHEAISFVNEINRFIGLPEEENPIAETIDLTGI